MGPSDVTVRALDRAGYLFGTLRATDVRLADETISAFASLYEHLGDDPYIPSCVKYRRRWYGVLHADQLMHGWELVPVDVDVFVQATNRLYSGARQFELAPPQVMKGPVVEALVRFDLERFGARLGPSLEVGVHMIRTRAIPGATAAPTPEGWHQDGFSIVSMYLIGRDRCTGGQSLVSYAPDGTSPERVALVDRLDTLVVNDRRVWHYVTPVEADGDVEGARDMLILTYADR